MTTLYFVASFLSAACVFAIRSAFPRTDFTLSGVLINVCIYVAVLMVLIPLANILSKKILTSRSIYNARGKTEIFLLSFASTLGTINPAFGQEVTRVLYEYFWPLGILLLSTGVTILLATRDEKSISEDWHFTPYMWTPPYERLLTLAGVVSLASVLYFFSAMKTFAGTAGIIITIGRLLPSGFGREWLNELFNDLVLNGATYGSFLLKVIPWICLVFVYANYKYFVKYPESANLAEEI